MDLQYSELPSIALASLRVNSSGRLSESSSFARKSGGVAGSASAAAARTVLPFVTHISLQERPDQNAAATQHQSFDVELVLEFCKRNCVIQFMLPSRDIRNSELSQESFVP